MSTDVPAELEGKPLPVVAPFKTGDESEFQKPDHDPHGETFAAVAHCRATCDNCGKDGLVGEGALETASGVFNGGTERPLHCKDCGV